MNVIQRPKPREFCATMREYIIDTDSTITFSVRYGGKTVLEEEYSPDADFKVRTRGLGKFCELALWGVWCAGENTTQTDAAGDFTFLINGVEDMTCFVMFSRLVTRKDAEAPGCLSEVNRKVTYPGAKEYVSGFPVDASGKKGMNVTAYWDDGTEETRFVAAGSNDDGVYTFDTSPDVVSSLFEKPDILLLDEPTNHLDLHAIEWLEQYLSTFKGTVVAISHDRYFLDRTITRVIEVLDGKAEFYSGNYSFYAVEKERRYLEKMRQYEKEQAKIAQLEKSAEQLRMFAFKGMDKTYRRALSMEKRIERMRTTDKPTKERALSAQFKSQEFYGDEVFALKKLKKSFGDRVLFHDVDLQVRGGERIALIGDNGTGKSTLIKMLMEEEYPDEGKIKFGPSVRIAYLPQIVEFDVPERNLVDTMLYSKRSITPQSARNRLAAFHFTGEDVFKSVSVLSGGELSRLKLCILMDEEVNLLILDEPTNHLDIASREWIEEAVESYDGTLLFVSHDRYFINRFATRVWELENGVITDYPMGFARYRQVKALEAQNKIDHTPKAVKEKTVTEKPKPNRSAQQARRQLTICEKEISTQETAIAEIEQRLEEAGGDYERYSEIYKEKEAAEQKLSALMEKWETLAEQAGE